MPQASEFAPLSLAEQLTVLLALSAGLFDAVPLEWMAEAKRAVQAAVKSIPAEICARFEVAAKLCEADRKTIVEIARLALERFLPSEEQAREPLAKGVLMPAAGRKEHA